MLWRRFSSFQVLVFWTSPIYKPHWEASAKYFNNLDKKAANFFILVQMQEIQGYSEQK